MALRADVSRIFIGIALGFFLGLVLYDASYLKLRGLKQRDLGSQLIGLPLIGSGPYCPNGRAITGDPGPEGCGAPPTTTTHSHFF